MPFIAIALLIAAAIGGGASVVAQNSLPGDALWGFKVGVNENVQAAFAAEGKAQADFDINAIEARLKEAGKLSAGARLDAEAQADIEENFESHAKSVVQQIEKLQAKGDYSAAADVAARFQAAVASNASTLAGSDTSADASAEVSAEVQSSVKSNLNSLMLKVRDTLDTASTVSADASAKASANADVDGSGSVQTDTSIKIDAETGVKVDI